MRARRRSSAICRLTVSVRSRSRSSCACAVTVPAKMAVSATAAPSRHDPPTYTPLLRVFGIVRTRTEYGSTVYNRPVLRERETVAEIACLVLLLGYLMWVPLPFGSASDAALTPLVVPPLLLCAASSVLSRRDLAIRDTRHARLWIAGGALLLAFMAMQLLPLPLPVLKIMSPQSARLWSAADRI